MTTVAYCPTCKVAREFTGKIKDNVYGRVCEGSCPICAGTLVRILGRVSV